MPPLASWGRREQPLAAHPTRTAGGVERSRFKWARIDRILDATPRHEEVSLPIVGPDLDGHLVLHGPRSWRTVEGD